MKIIVQAIYENGLFRPAGPLLELEEGDKVLLTIVKAPNALGPFTPVDQEAHKRVAALIKWDEEPGVTPELQLEVRNAIQIGMSNVRDPEVMRQAAERMDRMSKELYDRVGLLDISQSILREIRDGE